MAGLSANTDAQNPDGRVRPPFPGSHPLGGCSWNVITDRTGARRITNQLIDVLPRISLVAIRDPNRLPQFAPLNADSTVRYVMLVIAALIGAVVAAHMVPFPFLFEAFRPSRSLWHVKPKAGAPATLYITFDDGPNARWTPPGSTRCASTMFVRRFF